MTVVGSRVRKIQVAFAARSQRPGGRSVRVPIPAVITCVANTIRTRSEKAGERPGLAAGASTLESGRSTGSASDS